MNETTFRELDEFLDTLEGDNTEGPTTLGVLTDVLFAAPDIPSCLRLQQRRTAVFVQREEWDHAAASAKLEVVLAYATPTGPLAAMTCCLGTLESAGVSSSEQQEFTQSYWPGRHDAGATSELESTASRPRLQFLDRPLRSAGSGVLAEANTRWVSARHMAFVSLWAGDGEKAMRAAHAALGRTPTSLEHLAAAFGDLCIVANVMDGRCRGSHWLLDWAIGAEVRAEAAETSAPENAGMPSLRVLATCDWDSKGRKAPALKTRQSDTPGTPLYRDLSNRARIELLGRLRSRLATRSIEWGTEALRVGQIDMAGGFWGQAVECLREAGEAVSAIDEVSDIAKGLGRASDHLAVMNHMLPHLSEAGIRRHLLIRVAELLLRQGKYTECLDALDRADALCSSDQEKNHMKAGFMRALSFIRLRRFDDAMSLLRRMENWPGQPAHYARAGFLAGWVHLQRYERPEAILSFRRVIDMYPDAPFAAKARQMVARMQGS